MIDTWVVVAPPLCVCVWLCVCVCVWLCVYVCVSVSLCLCAGVGGVNLGVWV